MCFLSFSNVPKVSMFFVILNTPVIEGTDRKCFLKRNQLLRASATPLLGIPGNFHSALNRKKGRLFGFSESESYKLLVLMHLYRPTELVIFSIL